MVNSVSEPSPSVHTGLMPDLENPGNPGPLVPAAGGTFAAFLAIPTGPFAPLAAGRGHGRRGVVVPGRPGRPGQLFRPG
jgi:hypothetical protein